MKPRLTLDFDDLDSRGDFDTTKAHYRAKLAQCSFAISVRERNLGVVSNAVRVTSVAVPDDRLPELGSFQAWTAQAPLRNHPGGDGRILRVALRISAGCDGGE